MPPLPVSPLKHKSQAVIAVIGNPNTGKSALFNLLTGMRQKVANYPGVTVEKRVGKLSIGEQSFQLVDLPGTYSLSAHSPDERAAVDVLLGRISDMPPPDAVLVVVDATNIKRNLFVATEILELGIPVVIALNMIDIAEVKNISINVEALAARLGVTVIPTIASAAGQESLEPLKAALAKAASETIQNPWFLLADVKKSAENLMTELSQELTREGTNAETKPVETKPVETKPVTVFEVHRALIDKGGETEKHLVELFGKTLSQRLQTHREQLTTGQTLAERDAHERYDYITKTLEGIIQTSIDSEQRSWSERVDQVVSHPVLGSLLFLLVMATVFQAVFAWATPLMDLIDGATTWVTGLIYTVLPDGGALASLLADGVVAGVGSVVIFLPQILILFTFIIVLEDSGYMARAAFLMDRSMRWCGLSGHSFVPMLSSFACAVPAIMGTRVIPNPRDRIATIMAAPFMTCSARLPIYALLIAAFIPQNHYFYGLINLQGLVLLSLYLLGIAGGVMTAFLLKRTILHGSAPSFLMELPPYRTPNFKSVLVRLLERGKAFLVRAGTVIFFVSVIVWALAYFPRSEILAADFEKQKLAIENNIPVETERAQAIVRLENELDAAQMEQSLLGRMGKTIAPLFKPLGWDWKLSAAVIASFPAREVVIAVLGTTYAVGGDLDAEDETLRNRVRNAAWPDGTKVFSPAIAIGLMVFYALCLQCAATVAVIRRETNSWRWPAFAWLYMTTLGYLGALACAQFA
ncbi:MAG: ferrous iron transport protein B [Pseudomonadales bacterium]|nr:ferrous iron transport protein B [Pseudomonadales bacterium]